jgi:hypothetical protein
MSQIIGNVYEEIQPITEQIRLANGTTTTLTALLSDIISRLTEFNNDSGILTNGSATTVVDTTRSWATDIWKGAKVEVIHGGIHYFADVTGNNATTLTFATVGVTLIAGDTYQIKAAVDRIDLARINGTAITGNDWTTLFQQINQKGFNLGEFDKVTLTTPDAVTEVYTFELAAVTTHTVTIVYTDATKQVMSTATKA